MSDRTACALGLFAFVAALAALCAFVVAVHLSAAHACERSGATWEGSHEYCYVVHDGHRFEVHP